MFEQILNNMKKIVKIKEAELTEMLEAVINKVRDTIKGGKADNMSLEDIALKHKVSVGELEKQYEMGIKVEMEHTSSKEKAGEIARDHLAEDPQYYTKLHTIHIDEEKLNPLEKLSQIVDLKNKQAKTYHDTSEEFKLVLDLIQAVRFSVSHFIQHCDNEGVNYETLFPVKYFDFIKESLIGLHYKYSVGKYTLLKDISKEDFLKGFEEELLEKGFNILTDVSEIKKMVQEFVKELFAGEESENKVNETAVSREDKIDISPEKLNYWKNVLTKGHNNMSDLGLKIISNIQKDNKATKRQLRYIAKAIKGDNTWDSKH